VSRGEDRGPGGGGYCEGRKVRKGSGTEGKTLPFQASWDSWWCLVRGVAHALTAHPLDVHSTRYSNQMPRVLFENHYTTVEVNLSISRSRFL